MLHVAPWQLRRQCLPHDLPIELGQIFVQRILQKALLLGAAGELLARRGEFHALEHRHFVRELVDERLLERHVALASLDQRVLGAQLFVARGHLGQKRRYGLRTCGSKASGLDKISIGVSLPIAEVRGRVA